MNINCKKSAIQSLELALDTVLEQPIDCDALLPEFCPDIVRVLKCAVKPGLSGVEQRGKSLELSGLAEINVYYISTAGSINCATYKVPFSKTYDIKTEMPICASVINTFTPFASCRAVNQRRLDIRAAIGISIQLLTGKDELVVSEVDMENLHILEQGIQLSKLSDEISTEIRISEDLEQSETKPAVKDILRTALSTEISSVNRDLSGLTVKGDAELVVFYRADDGSYDTLEYSFPFSSVIPANTENIDELYVSDRVLMYSCELKDDDSGLLEVDAAIELTLTLEQKSEVSVCADAFSTKNTCKLNHIHTGYCTQCQNIAERVHSSQAVPCDEKISELVHYWHEPMGISSTSRDSITTLSMSLNICIEVSVCADAFSTKNTCKLNHIHTGYCTQCQNIAERVHSSQAVPCDEKISELVHYWHEPMGISSTSRDSITTLSMSLNICMIYVNEDGELLYTEKRLTVDTDVNLMDCQRFVMPQARVYSCKASAKNSELLVELDVNFTCKVFYQGSVSLVSDIDLDESAPIENPPARGLYIYRPDDGEKLWDIAKLYRTAPEMLAEENSDTEQGFVIIPVV